MTLSPVILEYNPSSNSKIRLCAAPARRDKISSHSVNEQTGRGLTNIPNLAKILLKYRLSLQFSSGDITTFYTNIILDVKGSLVSSIYLQDKGPGT